MELVENRPDNYKDIKSGFFFNPNCDDILIVHKGLTYYLNGYQDQWRRYGKQIKIESVSVRYDLPQTEKICRGPFINGNNIYFNINDTTYDINGEISTVKTGIEVYIKSINWRLKWK